MTDSELVRTLLDKESALRRIIREAASGRGVLVAYSGGVDSGLLLWEAVQALGSENVTAITAASPSSIAGESESASAFARTLGVAHEIVSTPECSDPRFLENTPDRCYVCKHIRYDLLKRLSRDRGGAAVLDGTQADDDPADRPGMRALLELEIVSPLAAAGLGKREVRYLLEKAGFHELSKKRAEPCLATRIPTGTAISLEALERVGKGEAVLRECGLETVRLRDHFPLARIVTDEPGITVLGERGDLRDLICDRLHELGYIYVTLDLQEYGTRAKASSLENNPVDAVNP